MTVNPVQTTPYIDSTRKFTQDPALLENVLSKMYVDVANGVNSRVIGIYEQASSITGEKWFSDNSSNINTKRQTQRRVYQFSDATLTFNHGLTGVTSYTRIYGTFTDGTVSYPLPYVNPTAANQVGVSVTATQVVVTKGGGAPAITSGFVVLEYLQQ
jgi:hypothetical protein